MAASVERDWVSNVNISVSGNSAGKKKRSRHVKIFLFCSCPVLEILQGARKRIAMFRWFEKRLEAYPEEPRANPRADW
jgi:hypothetical protein